MNKAEFFKHIEKGKIQQVYLLTGEQYFVGLALEKLKERIFPDKKTACLEIFYSDECDIDEVIRSIKHTSLFSDKKMVILKRAEALTKEKIDALFPAIEEPPYNTFIIIVAGSDMKQKSLSESISKKFGTAIKFPEFKKAQDLRGFIMDELESAGLSIDYNAVNLLLELSGNSLFNIKNEIEKLKISFKNKKISAADIETSVFADIKDDFYGIFNGICARDSALAMKSFRSVLKKDFEYFTTMSSIATYLFGLYAIKLLIERGFSDEEIFNRSGESNRWIFDTKLKGSQNYTKKELQSAIKKLAWLDVMLKSSSINKMILFDDFFLSLDKRAGTNSSQV